MNFEEDSFNSLLAEFVGLECWGVTAGTGAGSHVSIDLGGKILRLKPLKNPIVSDLVRDYVSEFSVFVENCDWRLESSERVLCSSKNDNREGQEMLVGLGNLLGCVTERLESNCPGHDLNIYFSKSIVLRLFCDSCSEEEGDNYSLFAGTLVTTIGPWGKLAFTRRTKRSST